MQEVDPTPDLSAKAETLAAAAVDRSKSLFDLSVANEQVRYWWDFTFFLQLLAEGLSAYVHTFGPLHPDTARKVTLELWREADYLQTYVVDNSDGLYVLPISPLLIRLLKESLFLIQGREIQQ